MLTETNETLNKRGVKSPNDDNTVLLRENTKAFFDCSDGFSAL